MWKLLLWRPFTVCKCSDGSYNVRLIPFDQFQSLTADSDATLHSSLFCLNSWAAVAFCQGKPDFGIRRRRSECMNAENLCTTYYLVLLFSMWTPALRCGVYLFTCLCLTLCALHRLCSFQFGWLWWNGYERTTPILISLTYWLFIFRSCITGCPLSPHPSPLAHPCIFLYFDTIFDYVYCPSYSELVKAF